MNFEHKGQYKITGDIPDAQAESKFLDKQVINGKGVNLIDLQRSFILYGHAFLRPKPQTPFSTLTYIFNLLYTESKLSHEFF